jgi:hypothetical protein
MARRRTAGIRATSPKRPSQLAKVTQAKAKKILTDGTIRGTKLTPKQRGLFGAIAGGAGRRRTRR